MITARWRLLVATAMAHRGSRDLILVELRRRRIQVSESLAGEGVCL
jgi:hypothetical protein